MSDGLVGNLVELRPVTRKTAEQLLTGDRDAVPSAADYPHEDTLDALSAFLAGGADLQRGSFFVVRRADGVVVGDCGVRGAPDASGTVEIGYGLAASARGQGAAGEAVRILVGWLRTVPGVRHVAAETLADNAASRRLLERAGFALMAIRPPDVRYVLDLADS